MDTKNFTVLLVEDDLNDIFLVKRAFKLARVRNPLQVVTDGQEAIDYLQGAGKFADRAQFPLPCLVLLDLNMPCVPVLDVLRWIRHQAGMSIAVLILSTSGEESDIAAAYRLGANGFLIKPSKASKLAEMAKAIKDFWLTHATLPKEALAAPAESVLASARANPFPDKQMLPGEWAALTSRTMAH